MTPISGTELEEQTIRVGSEERSYRLAVPQALPAPLLLVLHGMGLNAKAMVAWTGLGERGPQAGFATVFPEARREIWDDQGVGRRDGVDDAAFIASLVQQLVVDRIAHRDRTFLVGLSNGASFAERLARHRLLDAAGVVLVAGTARQASRRTAESPGQAAPILLFEGTADPMMPYGGGHAKGPLAWIARRRRKALTDVGDRGVVPVDLLANDWASANGQPGPPVIEPVPLADGDVRVDRVSWRAPGRFPVVLYRIVGGGHGWPGGPQYVPALMIGRITRQLDATAILLDFAREAIRSRA